MNFFEKLFNQLRKKQHKTPEQVMEPKHLGVNKTQNKIPEQAIKPSLTLHPLDRFLQSIFGAIADANVFIDNCEKNVQRIWGGPLSSMKDGGKYYIIEKYVENLKNKQDIKTLIKTFEYGKKDPDHTPYAEYAHLQVKLTLGNSLGPVGYFIGWFYCSFYSKNNNLKSIEELEVQVKKLIDITNYRSTVPLIELAKNIGYHEEFRSSALEYLPKDDPNVVQTCFKILENDPSPYVKHTAALILGPQHPRAFEMMVNILESSEGGFRKGEAASILGKIGDEKAIDYLIKIMENFKTREKTISALEKIGGSIVIDLFIKDLIKDLKGKHPNCQTLEALLRMGIDIVDPLINLIKKLPSTVYGKKLAVKTLGEIGDLRALDPLVKILKGNIEEENEYEDIRYAALNSIIKLKNKNHIKDKDYGELLIHVFKIDKDPQIKNRIAFVLGDSKDSRAVDSLITSIYDKRWKFRWQAVLALAKIGNKRAIKPITKALEKDTELLPPETFYEENRVIETFIGEINRVESTKKTFLKFRPVTCLKCDFNLQSSSGIINIMDKEISCNFEGGFIGGEINCNNCGEVHNFEIEEKRLTLSRRTVPIGYNGQVKKVFISNS